MYFEGMPGRARMESQLIAELAMSAMVDFDSNALRAGNSATEHEAVPPFALSEPTAAELGAVPQPMSPYEKELEAHIIEDGGEYALLQSAAFAEGVLAEIKAGRESFTPKEKSAARAAHRRVLSRLQRTRDRKKAQLS